MWISDSDPDVSIVKKHDNGIETIPKTSIKRQKGFAIVLSNRRRSANRSSIKPTLNKRRIRDRIRFYRANLE